MFAKFSCKIGHQEMAPLAQNNYIMHYFKLKSTYPEIFKIIYLVDFEFGTAKTIRRNYKIGRKSGPENTTKNQQHIKFRSHLIICEKILRSVKYFPRNRVHKILENNNKN